jgi:cell division protein FtsW
MDADNRLQTKAKTESALRQRSPQPDFLLTIAVVGLSLFGIVMVFSASYYVMLNSDEQPLYFYLIQSSKWAAIGLGLMVILSFIPYKLYYRFAPALMAFGILLLAALLVPGIGATRNNASRWIELGPLTIMPGEIAKIAVILFVAWFFTKYRDRADSFSRAYVPMLLLMGLCFGLIFMQPNLTTAIIVGGIVALLTCIGGNPKRYLALTGAVGIGGVYALIHMNPDKEHFSRFTGFLNPFADAQGDFYQTVQALLALGAGEVTGVGPGRSVQKALYLPEAQNDYIFAIIGEEFGFIGCLAVLCAFLFLIWRLALVAINAPDRFGTLIAAGVTIWISLQVIMNIAVVTSLMPPTGVTLPFISYGGNAILLLMATMGIMLNISRESARERAAELRRIEEEAEAAEREANSEDEERALLSGYGGRKEFIADESYIGRRGDRGSSLSGSRNR